MFDQAQSHAVAKIAEGASYTSGISTAVGGAMGWLNGNGIAVGAICALITMGANIYFKYREIRIKERLLHEGRRREDYKR